MKTKRLFVRVSPEELLQIHKRAKKAGVNLSSFVVEICLIGQILERRPMNDEERAFYRLLSQYNANWQALSNLFAKRQDRELAEGLKEMIAVFRRYRANLLGNDCER